MIKLLIATMVATQAPVPAPSARATVEAMFDAFNRHDAPAMARMYAPDAVITSSDFCEPRRQSDVERTYVTLFKMASDIHDDIEVMVVEGDRVAVKFTAQSNATGLELNIMTFLKIRSGLIVEDHSVFDTRGQPCSR